MPVAATMPNITSPAPPSTNGRQRLDQRAHLRDQAEHDHDHARRRRRRSGERTPVTPTSPTFCEKQV